MAPGQTIEDGPHLASKGGGEKPLPAPQEVTLKALDNANTRYLLTLWWDKFPGSSNDLTVTMDGQNLSFAGGMSSWDAQNPNSVGGIPSESIVETAYDITDPKLLQHVADYFKITPVTLHRPDYQYTCQIITKPGGYSLPGPFPVTLQITNSGTAPFSIPRSGFANTLTDLDPFGALTFSAYYYHDPLEIIANPKSDIHQTPVENLPPDMGIVLNPEKDSVTLKPGETLTREVNLAQYLKIKQVGTYEIRGAFHFQIIEPLKDDKNRSSWSLPWNVLWDDYATAEFETIVKSDPKR